MESAINPMMALLHDAFTYARHAYDDATHATQKWQFEIAHPELSSGAADAAYDRAAELCRAAIDLAEQVHDSRLSGNAAITELERRCPGFSNATYTDAFGEAMFATR